MFISLRRKGFTLIELLTVISIIAILSAIVLGSYGAINSKAGRSRAQTEISAIELACTRYQVENGDYPDAQVVSAPSSSSSAYKGNPNDYISGDGAADLFRALMGRDSFNDSVEEGEAQFLELRQGQVANASGTSYIIDPFGLPFGYFYDPEGLPSDPSRKSAFNYVEPDIWSTSGKTTPPTPTLSSPEYLLWSKNWD